MSGQNPVTRQECEALANPEQTPGATWQARRLARAHLELLEEVEEWRALIALVMDRVQEAGGTLDSKLQHQIITDLQQDIRQGGQTALDWWRNEFRSST